MKVERMISREVPILIGDRSSSYLLWEGFDRAGLNSPFLDGRLSDSRNPKR